VSVEKIKQFLAENPRFINILRRAVEHEDAHLSDAHSLEWEWSDVRPIQQN